MRSGEKQPRVTLPDSGMTPPANSKLTPVANSELARMANSMLALTPLPDSAPSPWLRRSQKQAVRDSAAPPVLANSPRGLQVKTSTR